MIQFNNNNNNNIKHFNNLSDVEFTFVQYLMLHIESTLTVSDFH